MKYAVVCVIRTAIATHHRDAERAKNEESHFEAAMREENRDIFDIGGLGFRLEMNAKGTLRTKNG